MAKAAGSHKTEQWLLYRRQIKSGSILHSYFDLLRLIHLQRYTGAVLRGAARPSDSDRVGRSRGALTGADTEPRCAGTAANLLRVKGHSRAPGNDRRDCGVQTDCAGEPSGGRHGNCVGGAFAVSD